MALELPPRRTYSYPLGFCVQGTSVVFNNGAVHPATPQEIALWNEVERLAALYAALLATNADLEAGRPHAKPEWQRPTVV